MLSQCNGHGYGYNWYTVAHTPARKQMSPSTTRPLKAMPLTRNRVRVAVLADHAITNLCSYESSVMATAMPLIDSTILNSTTIFN